MPTLIRLSKGFGVAIALFVGLVWLLSRAFQPGGVQTALPAPPAERVAEAQTLRDIALDDEPHRFVVDVDYARQKEAEWYPRNEAPVLKDLVKEGRLPPVHERLSTVIEGKRVSEPLVMRGVEGIGTYGGTWVRGSSLRWIDYRGSASTLLRYDLYARDLLPHLAKAWDVSADGREFTFYLRRGIRWSDGHPFTADDILYWWDWEENCKDIQSNPDPNLLVRNQAPKVSKVGDYAVMFVFPESYGAFPRFVAAKRQIANAPAHYLKQYHPTHPERDPEKIAVWEDALKIKNPAALYKQVKQWTNPEHPHMWPWLYRKYTTLNPQSAYRNPYYWVVDTEGNQLPYIDRILADENITRESVVFSQGASSMQWHYNLFLNYTLYMRNRDIYDFDVYHWWNGEVPFVIYPNITMRDDAAPNGKALAALLRERRFRIALSVSIDRQRIIDAVYRGVGEPMAMVPEKGTPWYCEAAETLHHEYDPEKANRLLDELGLTQRDSEGYRTFPDGKRLTLIQSLPPAADVETMQFIIENWKAVGLRVIIRPQGNSLFLIEKGGRRQQLSWWSGNPHFPLRSGIGPSGYTAPGYVKWLNGGGPYAGEGDSVPGLAPPPGHPMLANLRLHAQAMAETDPAKQKALIDEALTTYADQVWSINISKGLPQLVIVRKGFRNVPKQAFHGYQTYSPGGNAGIETYFWDEPLNRDEPGTVKLMKELIATPVPRVGTTPTVAVTSTATPEPGSGNWVGTLIRWVVIGIAGLFVVMVAIRHPFVRKRLLMMLPMLAVISVMVFTIIQLPPGDYTTVRIAQLEEQGDLVQLQEIKEIRETFNLDRPVVYRYASWMGLRWFTSFKEDDKGLLQGHLGLSMKDNMPVNQLVGDRLLLTFCITLGSVLLTWLIALPVGIYSAVKQYSVGDYFFTSIAFLGMCIPTFLLALILSVVTGVDGLFSREFAAMEGWNWAKALDLMKHIWLPVVIVGVSATAGMIRVMRANLLDELKKPYVVTARAKGVRPIRLLLKYPVRIALNPFVSGIGGLFPALVSGSAIIAMVLGLPTVGPLMLNGVLDQDMYLAGSMLMVLGLLSIFGTLVSDLLLVWLDPRIRYDQ